MADKVKDIENSLTEVVKGMFSAETIEAVDGKAEPAKQEETAPATTGTSYINLPRGTRVIITDRRTERMHIVVSKNLRAKIEKEAKKAGLSINELLNEILAEQFNDRR